MMSVGSADYVNYDLSVRTEGPGETLEPDLVRRGHSLSLCSVIWVRDIRRDSCSVQTSAVIEPTTLSSRINSTNLLLLVAVHVVHELYLFQDAVMSKLVIHQPQPMMDVQDSDEWGSGICDCCQDVPEFMHEPAAREYLSWWRRNRSNNNIVVIKYKCRSFKPLTTLILVVAPPPSRVRLGGVISSQCFPLVLSFFPPELHGRPGDDSVLNVLFCDISTSFRIVSYKQEHDITDLIKDSDASWEQ
ncbi:hypothetical protein F2P81_024706 [Scophthalmus maximus]|uniref:Uncharacterized protein n=1 Tax=Scophthalmus maximus TaxID=52904 RepID=A0A6A4RRF4_SCOMX|nr:hypothetical protein F2P81_024706 [Scophthalmus maximus]